ncbi:MAG: hypothetical protein IPK82_34820 [Polyangiaceae bacterium]|nr:hypothetical protein [Polyangiaceae bacterium]
MAPQPPRITPGLRPVSVCIGSDDPIIFATSLLEEYQILADALTRGGVSDDEARGWINKVRRTGLDTRFTVDPAMWPCSLHDVPRLPDHVGDRVADPP